MRIWCGFGLNFFHKLGWILDLSNFTDLVLDLALILSRIWTWIQFVLQFWLDTESIKFDGFGLGQGQV